MSTLTTSKKDDYIPLLESSSYSVKGLLGVGAFGSVYECIRLDTNEVVATKVIPKHLARLGQHEVHNLQRLREFDPDTVNLVRFKHHFNLSGHVILEFEILDLSVMDLFERLKKPFKLSEIQMMTRQMLVALNTLRGIGVIHTDIKLDNIMLVNHELHPFKVKLIDFGLACDVRGLCLGDILYIPEHRAPEIYLGLHLNAAVDMWALGCVMVSLYIHANLFSGKCRLGTMKEMVQWLGQPDDHLLNSGIYTLNYFYRNEDTWRLKLECTCSTGNNSLSSFSSYETVPAHKPLNSTSLRQFTSLKDIVMTHSRVAVNEDTQAFISFLVQILQVDPQKRISPSKALMHPFITMEHFPSDLINDSLDQTKASGPCTATSRSLEDALGKTSIISESLASFGVCSGLKFKAKNWFVRKIHRFVPWLFKTAILDKDVTICTTAEPTSTDGTTDKTTAGAADSENKRPAVISGEAITICINGQATTAADKTNASSDKSPRDEKPPPTAPAAILDTNDGLAAASEGTADANNRPMMDPLSPTATCCELTAAVDRPNDAEPSPTNLRNDVNPSPAAIVDAAGRICTNNRPTAAADRDEKPSASVNLDEACDNCPQGRVNSDDKTVETSFASAGHGSKVVEGSAAGSKVKLKKQFLKRIHRYFIGLLKKGPFNNCLNVSDNKETAATSNENPSPTAITHDSNQTKITSSTG